MRTTAVAVSALAVLAAGCGSQQAGHHGAHAALNTTAGTSAQAVSAATTTTTGTTRCLLSGLSVRLGRASGAAGSTYRPIVFTNTSATACTLRGYPGVAYVAPTRGRQVGAAASRDSGVRIRTVTLAPGGHAAALLRLVNYLNSPAGACVAKPVSGLRVYPPGSSTAAYVEFARHRQACSTDVHQLSVRVVLRGTTGE